MSSETESDPQVCEECDSEMDLRQSWTGNPYYICPECN